jgi:hypothetical protein
MRHSDDEKTFTAADVKDAAGMSYRQLNDWDTKGAVPGNKDRGEGWRKFSLRDLFAIMICTELRSRFGIPLELIKFVHDFMRKAGADHLRAALKLVQDGFSVYLLTDFRETFIIDNDLEFESLLADGYFRDERHQGYVFLSLNNIVSRLFAFLDGPIELKKSDDVYRQIAKGREKLTARTPAEQKILEFVRQRDADKIVISLRDGMITRVEIERPTSVKTDELGSEYSVTKESAFETVEFRIQDSKVMKARRRSSHKFDVEDNKKALFAIRIKRG